MTKTLGVKNPCAKTISKVHIINAFVHEDWREKRRIAAYGRMTRTALLKSIKRIAA